LTTFGDGATSEGDFHESLNFAGVYRTPNVFVCLNNQYAISLPRSRQTAAETIAMKASAYGIEGVLVDGNDILAVLTAVTAALDKARKGEGPTLVEAYTYRMSDHTTSDDASKYRSEKEVEEWEKKDPIRRFRLFLKKKKIWTNEFEESLRKKAEKIIDKAVREAESAPPPEIADLFRFAYQSPPPKLMRQMEEMNYRIKDSST